MRIFLEEFITKGGSYGNKILYKNLDLRPFLELPDFQTFFCPFSVLRIFRFLALPEIAHFRFEISGNRFSAGARAENVGDFRHGPLPKIWCRKCLKLKHAASHAHHRRSRCVLIFL